jgi:hypothetical protein
VTGKLLGASYIDEKFETKMLERLSGEEYLVRNGRTLKSIAQAKTTTFEHSQKRIIDVTQKNSRIFPVVVHDLREQRNKGFHDNYMEIDL